MARTLIGYGTTNAQGIATLDHDANDQSIEGYVGEGTGALNIRAVYGSLQSEIYELWDTLLYDNGSNTSYNKGSAITVTESSTGKSCSVVSTTVTSGMLIYTNALSGDFEIIIQADTSNFATRIGVSTSSTIGRGSRSFIQVNHEGTSYYRFKRVSGVYSGAYSNDAETWTNVNLPSNGNNAGIGTVYPFIGQYNTSSTPSSFSFTDLKVYHI